MAFPLVHTRRIFLHADSKYGCLASSVSGGKMGAREFIVIARNGRRRWLGWPVDTELRFAGLASW